MLWGQLWRDVANLSSGASNGYKAMLALEYRKQFASAGGTIADNISTPEAFAIALGFPVKNGAVNWAIVEDINSKYKTRKEDIQEVFNQHSRILIAEGLGDDQLAYQIKMAQLAMSLYKDDPEASKMWWGW